MTAFWIIEHSVACKFFELDSSDLSLVGLSFVVGQIHTFIVEIPHFWRKTPTKDIYHEQMEGKACKLQTHLRDYDDLND